MAGIRPAGCQLIVRRVRRSPKLPQSEGQQIEPFTMQGSARSTHRACSRPRRLTQLLLVLDFVAYVSGCGTIISGTRQDVRLATFPADALVTIYRWNGEVVVGPVSASVGEIEVHRPEWKQSYIVEVYKEGYCPLYFTTDAEPSAGAWVVLPFLAPVLAFQFVPVLGAVVAGGIVTPITFTDGATGGCCKLSPDVFQVRLEEAAACRE